MGALFGRIAREIGDRVEGSIALHELFHMPAAEATGLLRTSKALLEAWHANYMQVRRVCQGACSEAAAACTCMRL